MSLLGLPQHKLLILGLSAELTVLCHITSLKLITFPPTHLVYKITWVKGKQIKFSFFNPYVHGPLLFGRLCTQPLCCKRPVLRLGGQLWYQLFHSSPKYLSLLKLCFLFLKWGNRFLTKDYFDYEIKYIKVLCKGKKLFKYKQLFRSRWWGERL